MYAFFDRDFISKALATMLAAFLAGVCALGLNAFLRSGGEFGNTGVCRSEGALPSAVKKALQTEISNLSPSAGSGVLTGVLGGYGAILSDFAWIKTYVCWEKKDAEKCLAAMDLAVSLDPMMTQFWIQGARMIAYDMPHWKFAQLQKASGKAPSEQVKNSVTRRMSMQAIRFVDRALKFQPDNTELIAEKGQIYLNRLDDYSSAAESYGRIMKLEKDPPVFVRRIYAGCLMQLGRNAESLAVLEDLLEILDKTEPLYPIIQGQIDALKASLTEGK